MNASAASVAQLEGVSKRYADKLALDQVDLTVRRGEVLAVLGPNGAGKTTAISLLLGLTEPSGGHATVLGHSPRSLAARRRIGTMLQATAVPDTLTAGELIALFRSYYPQPRTVADTVAMAGVGDLLRTRYGRLSGGQQRRVQFALAICGRPQVLFLDEPTTGLDLDARETMWKTIRRLVAEDCAVVLTTHYLEEAEVLAERVSVLVHGRIVAEGSVASLRSRVSQRRIRCVTTLCAQTIESWDGVNSVSRSGDHLEIASACAESVVRRLLHADAALTGLEVQRAGLAEAFVEITREAA